MWDESCDFENNLEYETWKWISKWCVLNFQVLTTSLNLNSSLVSFEIQRWKDSKEAWFYEQQQGTKDELSVKFECDLQMFPHKGLINIQELWGNYLNLTSRFTFSFIFCYVTATTHGSVHNNFHQKMDKL